VSQRRLQPPDADAPLTAHIGTDPLDLLGLAQEVCQRYLAEFPDDLRRYGAPVSAWCVHDNQYLLSWGVEAVNGYLVMTGEVSWLARVLEARGFPLAQLARNLEICSEVVAEQVSGDPGQRWARVLADAAAFVRSRRTFL
jgi:hypothetical protein